MDEPRTSAQAILFQILRNQLEQYCFGDRSLRILQCCQKFLGLQFPSQQILDVHEFAGLEFGREISIGSLERAFNCSRAAVKRSLKNRLELPSSRAHGRRGGRHPRLAPASGREIPALDEDGYAPLYALLYFICLSQFELLF
jgi:hypothetical protein